MGAIAVERFCGHRCVQIRGACRGDHAGIAGHRREDAWFELAGVGGHEGVAGIGDHTGAQGFRDLKAAPAATGPPTRHHSAGNVDRPETIVANPRVEPRPPVRGMQLREVTVPQQ